MKMSDAEVILTKMTTEKQKLIDAGLPEVDTSIAWSVVDCGQSYDEYFCAKCGHVGRVNNGVHYGYTKSTISCSSCGNKITSKGRTRSFRRLWAEKSGTDVRFYIGDIIMSIDVNEQDWYLKKWNTDLHIASVGFYKMGQGWFIMDKDRTGWKMLRQNTARGDQIIGFLNANKPVNVSSVDFVQWMQDAQEDFKQIQVKKNRTKSVSKSVLLETLRSNYKAKDVDEAQLLAANKCSVSYLYSAPMGGNSQYYISCGDCRHEFVGEMSNDVPTICPNCGKSISYLRSYASNIAMAVVYENTNLPDNDLLIRVFKVTVEISATSGGAKLSVSEIQRLFAAKTLVVYNKHKDKWEKGRITDSRYELLSMSSFYTTGNLSSVIQSENELRRIIGNSAIAHSGLIESYGLDEKYVMVQKAPNLAYLVAWYRNPGVELVLKANLTKIMADFLVDPYKFKQGTTLHEVLDAPERAVRLAIKNNWNRHYLNDFTNLYNADNNVGDDVLALLEQNCLPVSHFVNLKKNFGISFTKTLQYLQNVYDYQCIEKKEAIEIWYDYLKMANAVGIDLTDKNRKFPSSLKKDHDVASFAFNAIKEEVRLKQFEAQTKQNVYYEYSYKDLVAIVPKKPQDIVEEASRQHNCLRSYVERVGEGETVIVFVRRKGEETKTFLTAEINDKKLLQLKGYGQSSPRTKEILEFMEHWSKARGFAIAC